MIEFPLALRQTSLVKAADAWLIPGGSADVWLDEICRWGVAMDGLRLIVLPTSARDPKPLALLVTNAQSLDRRNALRSLPYAKLAGRLFVPAEAILEPPVSDSELQSALVWPIQVLHPSIGLVGFREEDLIGVDDLLGALTLADTVWNRAVAGIAVNNRLRSVSPVVAPTITIIIEEGRDDIGADAPSDLPPDESESKIKEFIAKALTPGMKALSKIKPPGLPPSMTPGLIQQIADWARGQVIKWSPALLDERLKELRRLQNLFESDPDAALRHALPLTGSGGRGIARPSSKLGNRNVDFNASRINRSGAVDGWYIPDDTRQTLIAKYRAAANRELALGRYRRAAYIFAELLGDRAAAAGALKQGRYFHEAAALYRDLKDNANAARCLEEGGLLVEAIALHARLGNFEKAGDLSRILKNEEEAERYYRDAVNDLVGKHALVPAAKLLETKLSVPDEALALLTHGWPSSSSAALCLTESFRMLADLGRHPESVRRIDALRAGAHPTQQADWAAQVLSKLARAYPNHEVRAIAADATRVIAGKALSNVVGVEASKPFIAAVTRVAPEDRLLQRDGARFLERRTIAPAKPSRPKQISAAPKQQPRLVRAFRLPPETTWDAATAAGGQFFATGANGPKTVMLLRGNFEGTTQQIPWPHGSLPPERIIDAGVGSRGVFIASLSERSAGGMITFPPSDQFPAADFFWTPPLGVGWQLAGLCHDDSGGAFLLSADDNGLAINPCVAGTGVLTTSYSFPAPNPLSPTIKGRLPFAARGDGFFIANENKLYQMSLAEKANELTLVRTIDLPSAARGIVATPPFVRERLAVTLAEGGMVVWADGTTHPFAHGMFDPLATFTRGGALVAINSTVCRVYDTSAGKLVLQSSFHFDGPPPIAIMPTNKLNEFAFLATNGGMRIFEIPE